MVATDDRMSRDLDKERKPNWATPFSNPKPYFEQNLGDRMQERFEQERRAESDMVEGKDLEYIKNFRRDYLVQFRIYDIDTEIIEKYSDAQIRNAIDAFILKGEWSEYAGGSMRVYMPDDEYQDYSITLEMEEAFQREIGGVKAAYPTTRKVLIPKEDDE